MIENTDINSRVKDLRKIAKLTQNEFSDKLGITQGTLSGIENGNVTVSNQIITSICREFNVTEKWLKTGQGEIFVSINSDTAFAKAVSKTLKDEDQFIKNMFIEMSKWTTEEREFVKKAMEIIKRSNF